MPYQPRAYFPVTCAHCGLVFEAKHLGRKYCSTPCNALATRARKQGRLTDLAAQLAAAEAELARVQAALAAQPATTLAAAVPPVRPPEPARAPLRIAAFKAPVTAQTLLRQARRYAGRVRVSEVTRTLGQVHLPHTDPHTVLQQHVAGQGLWWRHHHLPGLDNEWVRTNTFWVGTDERIWVEVVPQHWVYVVEVTNSLERVVKARLQTS